MKAKPEGLPPAVLKAPIGTSDELRKALPTT